MVKLVPTKMYTQGFLLPFLAFASFKFAVEKNAVCMVMLTAIAAALTALVEGREKTK